MNLSLSAHFLSATGNVRIDMKGESGFGDLKFRKTFLIKKSGRFKLLFLKKKKAKKH